MKFFALAATAALLTISPATAQVVDSDGAGQPSENASCLATERATRNSKGGDRDQGNFGPAQDAFTALFETDAGFYWDVTGETYEDYGQFLKDWKAEYCG